MGVSRELPPVPTVFGGENSRRHGRIRCVSVRCNAGEVLDISASGARLRWRGWMRSNKGDTIQVTINGFGANVCVEGRIAWLRRLGWRRHEIGVEFQNVDAEARANLTQIARRAPVANESIERSAA